MSIKQNKGEWSEPYAFFKLVHAKEVSICDSDLQVNVNQSFEIISFKYSSQNDNSDIIVSLSERDAIIKNKLNTKTIPLEDYYNISVTALNKIKNGTGNFGIPEVVSFLERMFNPKAKSNNQIKRDLTIMISDYDLIENQYRGFSVKSYLGGASSLLNASQATNFTFRLKNGDPEKYKSYKTKKLIKSIGKSNLIFFNLSCKEYEYNLALIDLRLINIISELILEYYSSSKRFVKDLILEISKQDPLKIKSYDLYKSKICDFLEYTALGMVPTVKWNQIFDANGGMIIVKDDGSIVFFYVIKSQSRSDFREYLFNNSHLDTASTSRHNFGTINNAGYIDLNLLVRL